MKQFLFCSTVFKKSQFSIQFFKDEEIVSRIDYLLKHRENAVLWPLFNKADIKKCLPMDPSLPSLLRGVMVGSATCKIRYNGRIYQVDEITLSDEFKGYWCIKTSIGNCSFDPEGIEIL